MKDAGVDVPNANDTTDTVSLTQSEYTYYSETTNEDTIASKMDETKSVDMKDISIEATLEPPDIKGSPNGKISAGQKFGQEKRNVTPITSRTKASELRIDLEESKAAAQDRLNTARDDADSADFSDDPDEGIPKMPVSAEKLELSAENGSQRKGSDSFSAKKKIV